MLNLLDSFLNSITMYKLALYGLLTVAILAVALGFLNLLPYSGVALLVSLIITITSCYLVNTILSYIFKAPVNSESWIITALILFFIIWPAAGVSEVTTLLLASTLAMLSKYLLAISKRHIFNPVAIALVLLGIFANPNIIWWVGSSILFPAVTILGLLIVRKIRRFYLFFSFLIAVSISLIFNSLLNGSDLIDLYMQTLVSGPLIFFATVMLTEPQTTPPGRKLQIMYGSLIGLLFGSQFHLGPIRSTPELALVAGNVFSYLVGSKQKLILKLKEKNKLSPSIYELIFKANQKLIFKPGQYLEWTVPHKDVDIRGNRRYFTIASSPTEEDLKIGIKVAPSSSSFKKALIDLNKEQKIVASQLSGDFILPEEDKLKLVFIAGGIGVTPFRSMVKYLIDTNQKRDIILFYSNVMEEDFVYKDIFGEANKKFGLKTVYILTDPEKVKAGWKGKVGYINEQIIKDEVPDYKSREYYLSGPVSMVNAYKKLLSTLGVPMTQIKTDYFSGY